MKIKKLEVFMVLLFILIVSGCGSSGIPEQIVSAERFRLLQLGDTWTYSETSVYTPPGGAAPLAFLYTHTVAVVNKADPTGKNYLAFQHDFTPAPGTPPLGTEWDLFTQDPTTREVKLVGNITPSGQFIAKGNTLFAGAYFYGLTYKNDWDVSDNIVNFNSVVLGKTRTTTEITIPGGYQKLDTWVVESTEISEPGGQNVFDQGYMTTKINPTIGNAIEFDASFSAGIPGTIGGQRGKITLHSDLLATNVPIP